MIVDLSPPPSSSPPVNDEHSHESHPSLTLNCCLFFFCDAVVPVSGTSHHPISSQRLSSSPSRAHSTVSSSVAVKQVKGGNILQSNCSVNGSNLSNSGNIHSHHRSTPGKSVNSTLAYAQQQQQHSILNNPIDVHSGSFQSSSPAYAAAAYTSLGHQPSAVNCHHYTSGGYSNEPCYSHHPPSGLIRSSGLPSIAAGPFSTTFAPSPSSFHHLHHPIPTYGVPPYPYGHGSLGAPCSSLATSAAAAAHHSLAAAGDHRTSSLSCSSSNGHHSSITESNLQINGPNTLVASATGSNPLGPLSNNSIINSNHPHSHPLHPPSAQHQHQHHLLHHSTGQTSLHTKVPTLPTTMRSSPFPDPGDYHEKPRKRRWQEFPGRNRFYCDGRIMMAKQISVFYFTVTLLVVTVTLFFVFE